MSINFSIVVRSAQPEALLSIEHDRTILSKVIRSTLKFLPILQEVIISIEDEEVCVQVVGSLLCSGACTLLKDHQDRTALRTAVEYRKWAVVDLIVVHGSENSVKYKEFYKLCQCIVENDEQTANYLLDNIEDVDFCAMKEITPLRFAVAKNRPNFVKVLTNKGAGVHAQEFLKILPIFQQAINDYVLFWENFEILEILLKCGADPNYRLGKSSITALHFVCKFGDAKATEILLSFGAHLNVLDKYGSNVLIYAADNEISTDPLEFLLKLGIFDVNYSDNNGRTALFGRLDSISCANKGLLLKYGARIDIQDKQGRYAQLLCNCDDEYECPVIQYFRELKFLGYQVDDTLIIKVFSAMEEHLIAEAQYSDSDYVTESEQLKNIIVCTNPRYSFFDLLFLKKKDLTKFAHNEIISQIFQDSGENFETNFPHFGHILNRIVHKLNKKRNLLSDTRTSLSNVVGTRVPLIIVDKVISNLENYEIENICKINSREVLNE